MRPLNSGLSRSCQEVGACAPMFEFLLVGAERNGVGVEAGPDAFGVVVLRGQCGGVLRDVLFDLALVVGDEVVFGLAAGPDVEFTGVGFEPGEDFAGTQANVGGLLTGFPGVGGDDRLAEIFLLGAGNVQGICRGGASLGALAFGGRACGERECQECGGESSVACAHH